jgi:hypothetical protein
MFYIRIVQGPEKRAARGERVLINGIEYHSNEGGIIRCNLPNGQHEVVAGGKINTINAVEGEASIVEIE